MYDPVHLAIRQRPTAYHDAEPARMRAYADRLADEGQTRLAQILAETADRIGAYKAQAEGLAVGAGASATS